ncbi:hypothetical protein Pint_32677 [Pistacia integerrima]|uniref:Uncharacterized protein n=1 Tax=Pistacia integerrima TaxID=434235 RepID=A0ACC0XNL3_9ROSI|nr:hypothetical protein Pint_32677 [Pistacia integerrima]
MAEKVKLYGMWVSPFCRRVELALRLKGMPYECHVQVGWVMVCIKGPVVGCLLFNLVESRVQSPVEFAKYFGLRIGLQVLPTVWEAYFGAEKEKEKCTCEASQQLKLLEKELNGGDFFGGDSYVDIAAIVIAFWFRVTQEELLTKEKLPLPFNWIEKLQASDAVNECRPPIEKHLEFVRTRYEAFKSAAK